MRRTMTTRKTARKAPQPARTPREVRLPGFLVEEEVGMGDAIKKATSWAGLKPCGGCAQRAAALDQRVVLSPRGRQCPGGTDMTDATTPDTTIEPSADV